MSGSKVYIYDRKKNQFEIIILQFGPLWHETQIMVVYVTVDQSQTKI